MSASFSILASGVVRATASVAFLFLLLGLVLCLITPQQLSAATLADANQEAIRIQQQQEQRLERLEERARERRTLAPESPRIEPPSTDLLPDDQLCVVINVIVVEGNSLLTAKQITSLTNSFLNRCLSRNDINTLLQQITRTYFDKGYVTTRAYLKPQDVSQGSLVITVIEGKIESLGPVEGQDLGDNEIKATFPTGKGRILNLRDLEQGLDQLNRLQSNFVRMTLDPGTNPGDSHILLENDKSRAWHVSVGVDNGGQKSTGEYQGHLTYGLDNLIGQADYLNLNITQDLDPDSKKLSRSVAGLYELPWQWWLLQLSGSVFEYKKELRSTLQTFDTSGSSQNYRISADRVIQRNQTGKSTVGLTLNYKDERNYLEDVLLYSSSQKLTIARVKLQHRQQFFRTSLGLNLTVHQGLPALGAESDSNLPSDAPRAKFTKVTGRISAVYELPITKFPLRYSLTANGQFCETVLYGSEQINIGGLFTVRGYFNEGFSGERGGYVRNEVISTIIAPAPLRSTIVSVLEPFIAFDWGSVKANGSLDNSYNELAGWGVGLRGRGRYGRFDLLYAQPISPPAQFADRAGKLSFAVSVYL